MKKSGIIAAVFVTALGLLIFAWSRQTSHRAEITFLGYTNDGSGNKVANFAFSNGLPESISCCGNSNGLSVGIFVGQGQTLNQQPIISEKKILLPAGGTMSFAVTLTNVLPIEFIGVFYLQSRPSLRDRIEKFRQHAQVQSFEMAMFPWPPENQGRAGRLVSGDSK